MKQLVRILHFNGSREPLNLLELIRTYTRPIVLGQPQRQQQLDIVYTSNEHIAECWMV